MVEKRSASNEAPAVKVVSVKSFPKNADAAARHCNHDVRKKNGGRQQRDQQRDGQARQVTANKTPGAPPSGWHAIKRLRIPCHQPFSIETLPPPLPDRAFDRTLLDNSAFVHTNPSRRQV